MSPLVDRLLVSALIEARSCERFKLLIEAWPDGVGHDLKVFYEEGEQLRKLPCNHLFHVDCSNQWLLISGRCPLCNLAVLAEPATTG